MGVVRFPVGDPEWSEPVQLPGLPAVPPWSDDLLPNALRPWLMDVAERTQCPPEYAAVGAVVALASVVGRGCAIRPKQQDDWTVVPNLWGAVVGPPSAMKTPALNEALRPLKWLASKAAKDHEAKEAQRRTIEAKQAALKDAMKKAAAKQITDLGAYRDAKQGLELEQQYDALRSEAAEANATRRYVVYDSTVEALGEILAQSPRGVLVFRDEIVGWLKSMDRVGHENDRSFYLEAWNGDGSYVYDRIARGTIEIESACVSILGGIQPGPLGAYLRGATSGGAEADGLMQRMQLIVYPDPPKDWKNVDRWPDSDARDHARELFVRLAGATPEGFGADCSAEVPFVRFTPAAQDVFDGWRVAHELKLRTGDEHEVLEAHLTKYRSLVPSLALLFQLADHHRGPVDVEAVERAISWAELLAGHMRRVYGSVTQSRVAGARLLLRRLRSGQLRSPFTARDVYRHEWSGLSEPADVEAALTVLVDYGWARRETVATGGRPREEFVAHPSTRPQ